MVYNEFDFASYSSGKYKEREVFDCKKFYSESTLSFDYYKENAKEYFVTGDFEDSTEEDEEDYENEIVETQKKNDEVIESL